MLNSLEKRHLRVGPLSAVYTEGELRGLMLGGREVLRRIYAAVRDRDWGTVPATLSAVQIDIQPESFQISYQAEHRQGSLHFVRQCRITGMADGTVTFTMDGTARSAFLRNRIGCCVLHPIAECAGRPCRVTHADGTVEDAVFPEKIAPHQPFRQVQALAHEVLPGLWAEVIFRGDVFETEDQRNWTDASFKTYSTPLEIPFPVWIAAGTRIEQSITLRLQGLVSSAAPVEDAGPVQITFPSVRSNAHGRPLPKLGLGVAGHRQPLTTDAAVRLRALQLDHLRVDLTPSAPGCLGRLVQAASEAKLLGVRLLAALHLSAEAETELAFLCDAVNGSDWPLGGWLIFSQSKKCTPEPLLVLARRFLLASSPNALFFAGTDAYFVELNRAVPALTEADGIVYSINPQVHAFDDASLMETPAAQAATVQSARWLYPGHEIWISPVTLKPRFNPDATGFQETAEPATDIRQKSSLAAAWTLVGFKKLAEAGATGITYYETTGDRGVLERSGESFPVYDVLAAIGAYAGGKILSADSSHPHRVECLAMRHGKRIGLLLANMTSDPQHVSVSGRFQGQERTLSPYGLFVLSAVEY